MNHDETAQSSPATSFTGHRERLRQRFLAAEAGALSEEALLELLLSYAIARRDVQPWAKLLLAKFGNLDAVLAAEPTDLRKIKGVKDAIIALLKLTQHLRKTTRGDAPKQLMPQKAIPPTAPAETETNAVAAKEQPVPTVAEYPVEPRAIGGRKLQVSNGYLLDAPQVARLLSFIESKPEVRKISGAELIQGSGLSARQVANLVSMSSALGLITPRTQLLTPFGRLVARHDLFLDAPTTLEFCHFLAAGNPRNLVWFEVFNDMLATQPPMAQPAWSAWLRERLAGKYSDRSLVKHIAHEVRFLLDAYTVRNFKKLGLLTETPEKTFALRRYTALQPATLAAMIYTLGERSRTRLVPFADLHTLPGSPGRLFAVDSSTLRQAVETLHQREWLRFEVRHGLDQLRIMEGLEPLEFLTAAYESRAPESRVASNTPCPAQLLL
jgi:hypothetical protein